MILYSPINFTLRKDPQNHNSLGCVNGTKIELSIGDRTCGRGWLVENTDRLSGDGALLEEIVCDSRYRCASSDSAIGEVNWADAAHKKG